MASSSRSGHYVTLCSVSCSASRGSCPEFAGLRGPDCPLVSAIIPAKDEEVTLAGCLESVAGQAYPHLEIVVIDDRSIDRTGEIARAVCRPRSSAPLLSNDHLPAGWTGKTHVLSVASRAARGEWLWFLDADTVHAPEFLSVMIQYARTQALRSSAYCPNCGAKRSGKTRAATGGHRAHAVVPADQVNDDRSKLAFANGQSILIERQAYVRRAATRRCATGLSRTLAWPSRSRPWGCRSARSS